jgi:hypothetical protein
VDPFGEQALNESSPSADTRFSLASKVLLALASIASYALVSSLAEALEPMESVPPPGVWFPYVAGAIFGGFVLMPYVGADRRAVRIAALWVAGALIYRLAVWFATDGPLNYDVLVTFVITGAGAAVLCALAVALLAPRPYRPLALVFALVAGALGGASFELKVASDEFMVLSHGCWQLLVCLALHAGFDRSPST